ncbi:hypothetical protein [Novosphingobium rosa]|uniref:hypothetical protein n=1 Tax=Novosphingobium rosa TaxID=76978 RepID=UPI00082EA935|nr:hypothetical protein [Novosphingobium rosa]
MGIDDLRAATEDDVTAALDRAWVELPITTPAEALELFNVMLDHLTSERARIEAEDAARISDEVRRRSN